MNQVVAVLCFFVFAVAAQNSTGGGCDFFDTLPASTYQNLVSNISAIGQTQEKIQYLNSWAQNNTLGLTSDQTVGIIQLFGFLDARDAARNAINKFVLTLTTDGLVSIIQTSRFSSEKLDALRVFVNLTNAADLKANSSRVIDCFSFSDDKATARQIIASSNPRSCLFGPADIPRFAFIIDTSGSMNDKFTDSDGNVYTRLQYVQKDLLSVMNGTLRSSQQFNIISFANTAYAWQRGVVPVNYANIVDASAWVRKLAAGGNTYMLTAFKLAFSDPKVLGVYFLSDGDPSDNSNTILNYVTSLGKPVNTVAFKAGATASAFMQRLATVSKGTFRAIR